MTKKKVVNKVSLEVEISPEQLKNSIIRLVGPKSDIIEKITQERTSPTEVIFKVTHKELG